MQPNGITVLEGNETDGGSLGILTTPVKYGICSHIRTENWLQIWTETIHEIIGIEKFS